jgi:hypothetical protein
MQPDPYLILPTFAQALGGAQRCRVVRDAAGAFDHRRIAPGHPLRRHVLYRAQRLATLPP